MQIGGAFAIGGWLVQVDVRDNVRQVVARMNAWRDDVVQRAIPLALNRCAEMAKTAAAKELAGRYKLKSREIKAAIGVTRATAGRMTATLRIKRKPVPLIAYGARATKDGVSVTIKGSNKRIKGAFIATMPSGHRGVFKRVGPQHKKVLRGGKAQWSGLPIKELFGPSVGGAYSTQEVQSFMARFIYETFNRRLVHEIQRLTR
jgi:hypothetical protein